MGCCVTLSVANGCTRSRFGGRDGRWTEETRETRERRFKAGRVGGTARKDGEIRIKRKKRDRGVYGRAKKGWRAIDNKGD